MSEKKVIKRDGSFEVFDVLEIKRAIRWAASGTEVNPLELEAHIDLHSDRLISTNEIQEVIIDKAVSMVNIENDFRNLEWSYVAARLMLLSIYNESKKNTNQDPRGDYSYYDFVKVATEKGIYDKRVLEEYTKEELDEMSNELNFDYDRNFDYAGMNILRDRYLLKDGESYFEVPQSMYMTIALLVSLPEKKENRISFAKKVYHATAGMKISYATPIILNLRRPKGNLASCFITAMDDSLDSIYYVLDQLGQISKNAGGVGVNMSRVRSAGARIKGIKGASGGVLPWVKLVNDTAVAVNQLGSRAGAITVALDSWHKDIEEFLEMQKENGDQRKKAYDVFPQVVVSDLFMKRVVENSDWTLVDPHEIRKKYNIELAELFGNEFEEIYSKIEKDESLEFNKIVNARELFKGFLKTVIETGLPYLFFKDTTNKMNPNKHSGMIGNANLCTESFSNFSPTKTSLKKIDLATNKITQEIDPGYVHTCNLVSLNWAKVDCDNDIEETTKVAVRILDNTIDIGTSPIPEALKHNNDYRILGVGSLGLADYLAKRMITYKDSSEELKRVFELMAVSGIIESSDLAKERGVYKFYSGSDYDKGIFFGRDNNWYKENSKFTDKWEEAYSKVRENGIRNGGLFAIAPNTSTSVLVGATASVLPVYNKFFIEKGSSGATPRFPPFLNQETFWFYHENKNLDQNIVIDAIAEMQKWTDQGISMELLINLQNGVRAKEIYDMYINSWKKGCKTVYYVRSISKSFESKKEDCVSCSG